MQPPKYPADAIAAGLAGFVELQIAVSPNGTPDHIAIVRSTPAGVFDRAVLDAARHWRFAPALVDGEAVASDVRVPVKFELDPPDLDPDPASASASASAIAAMDTDTEAARTPHTVARSERVASCTQAECARRGALQ